MINKTIKKIHHHRFGFLVLISFMFLLFLGLNPIDLGKYYGARFGSAVGMSVGVPENPINKIAMQLKEKENNLNVKEKELDKLEKELNKKPNNDKLIIYLMGSGIVVLFLLILINFYLDRRHRAKNNV